MRNLADDIEYVIVKAAEVKFRIFKSAIRVGKEEIVKGSKDKKLKKSLGNIFSRAKEAAAGYMQALPQRPSSISDSLKMGSNSKSTVFDSIKPKGKSMTNITDIKGMWNGLKTQVDSAIKRAKKIGSQIYSSVSRGAGWVASSFKSNSNSSGISGSLKSQEPKKQPGK